MEMVQLWFSPGDRREGFRWSAAYEGRMVGICNQPFCGICNLDERKKLKGFSGGRLEVQLTLHRRPSFWEGRQFYLGHLVKVLPPEAVATDEGIEFDVSRFNAFLYLTPKGGVLIDPGIMGFNGGENPLQQLVNKRVIATIVTHGHQDHWNNLSVLKPSGPVFMTSLAFQLVSRHASIQRDFHFLKLLRGAKMMVPGEPVLLEQNLPLRIDTISLPHSIPETVGLVIRGEKARVVHLGDFKFNGMDPRTKAETIARFSEIAREKIDLLTINIINSHATGFTLLEELVIENLTNIIVRAQGRVVIACFSTNLDRIRRIAEVAQLLGRPVQFFGAGMENSQEFFRIEPKEGLVDFKKAVVFTTGCQSEEESVLWRIAYKQNPPLKIGNEDVLVFSSRCIPGREVALKELIETLRLKVAEVVVNEGEGKQIGLDVSTVEESLVHVSGHGSKEDIRLALELLRPEKTLPWPQTSPQLESFRQIADSLGIEILDERKRTIEI